MQNAQASKRNVRAKGTCLLFLIYGHCLYDPLALTGDKVNYLSRLEQSAY